MIRTKEDLRYYLEQDRLALHMTKDRPGPLDEIWKYQIVLRKAEYYSNKADRTLLDKVLKRYYQRRLHKLSIKYTTQIPINVCGPGLSIAHLGASGLNSHARIGRNLRMQIGVVVGGSQSTPGRYPVLGDNVYLGAGAKVLGGVTIADDVAIGANAVVVRDITEPGTTHAGIPAKKISDHNSHAYIDERVLAELERVRATGKGDSE